MNKKPLSIIIICFFLSIFVVQHINTNIKQNNIINNAIHSPNRLQFTSQSINQDDLNVTLPDNFTNDIVEAFLDPFWDIDGDSNRTDMVAVIWSYVPYFGSNGDALLLPLFIISIFIGWRVLQGYILERL